MLRLLKQEDFAILLMSDLASSPDRLISLACVAKTHGVSVLFLKKIARDLRKHGLVESREGANGGYRLARNPKLISVLSIMEAVQKERSGGAPAEQKCPLHTHCLPQTIRKTLSDTLNKSLQTISLFDITHEKA